MLTTVYYSREGTKEIVMDIAECAGVEINPLRNPNSHATMQSMNAIIRTFILKLVGGRFLVDIGESPTKYHTTLLHHSGDVHFLSPILSVKDTGRHVKYQSMPCTDALAASIKSDYDLASVPVSKVKKSWWSKVGKDLGALKRGADPHYCETSTVCLNKFEDCCRDLRGGVAVAIDSAYDISYGSFIQSMINHGIQEAYVSMLDPGLLRNAAAVVIYPLDVLIHRESLNQAELNDVIHRPYMQLRPVKVQFYAERENCRGPARFVSHNRSKVHCVIGETVYTHDYDVWGTWNTPTELVVEHGKSQYSITCESIFNYCSYNVFRNAAYHKRF